MRGIVPRWRQGGLRNCAGWVGADRVVSRIAELVTGRINFGKVEAAASVPGPGAEKKTENGVWFDGGWIVPRSDAV